jgi:hypothetical protein
MRNLDSVLPSALRADCSRCTGLCCVAPSFYSVQGFAFDKPAHSACRHLTPENRCAIHAERPSRGFPGCVGFDCYGAAQRVTQELFNGVSWRENSDAGLQMFAAYMTCVALHRLMALLTMSEAGASPPQVAQIRRKQAQLDELCRSEEAKSGAINITAVRSEVLRLVAPATIKTP